MRASVVELDVEVLDLDRADARGAQVHRRLVRRAERNLVDGDAAGRRGAAAVARVRPVDADVQIGIRAVADGVDHARLRGDAGQRPRRAVEIAVGVDAADVYTAEYHLVGRVGAAVGLEGDLADVDARRQAEGQAVVLLRRRNCRPPPDSTRSVMATLPLAL